MSTCMRALRGARIEHPTHLCDGDHDREVLLRHARLRDAQRGGRAEDTERRAAREQRERHRAHGGQSQHEPHLFVRGAQKGAERAMEWHVLVATREERHPKGRGEEDPSPEEHEPTQRDEPLGRVGRSRRAQVRVTKLGRVERDRIVRARPSTAMSCVAARKKNAKKSVVSVPTSTGTSTPPPSPSHTSMCGAAHSSSAPIAICAGTIHVLRRPKRLWYSESTRGAHSSLSENGQLAKENLP